MNVDINSHSTNNYEYAITYLNGDIDPLIFFFLMRCWFFVVSFDACHSCCKLFQDIRSHLHAFKWVLFNFNTIVDVIIKTIWIIFSSWDFHFRFTLLMINTILSHEWISFLVVTKFLKISKDCFIIYKC